MKTPAVHEFSANSQLGSPIVILSYYLNLKIRMMVHSINQISQLDLVSFIYETYEDINPLSFVFSFVFIFIFIFY